MKISRFLSLFIILILIAACGGNQETPKDDTPVDPVFAQGKAVYDADCRACHGENGAGGSETLLRCTNDSVTWNEKMYPPGSMSGFASSWSNEDKDAAFYFLNYDCPV